MGDKDELYDLANDPWEQQNVVSEAANQNIVHDLRLKLADWSIQTEDARAVPLPQSTQLGRELLRRLGFRLTHAQRRVVTEVLEDLSGETPMLRLLQGDVGSGKTVVAAFAAIRAAEHGRQTALMAPTEILAEQHYVNFSAWLEPLGIPVLLLTGSQSARERNARQRALEEGDALVAVGTHALFQDKVNFNALALTIVDEQHRFGVHQRMALRSKGAAPHQLVMTATPIPRTLTMALYADMDVSVLDELPPGRTPIETRVISDARKEEVIRSAADAVDSAGGGGAGQGREASSQAGPVPRAPRPKCRLDAPSARECSERAPRRQLDRRLEIVVSTFVK